ncbi:MULTISPECIES: DUF805 domain-containing protein [Shewanella]|uniref:DUF805 domain-containing protein n=1 Tax=Shewanella TaxID=22 RepID=UPI000C3BD1FF|nr:MULTISPECIES: DUF805 domain-containing protein [Shewanella]NCQ43738.1 DUF805 domain-containing protein [Shewanella frigidimarina]NCO70112.1 DUF805 domain-containing protein [Shewanella vesiculosa]NCP35652.1 DUF805 domain-containing protein [Shewanella vesiculosa]NCP68233.1 DUF805 domain-containing protein [Shewanella vesiculosa]NCP72807.1 DUF805 domain-containing protein [Shewanella vesiculosa]
MDWYLKVLKQYFDFSGRARRKEYWMFALISMIISIVLTLLDMGVGLYSELYGAGLLSSIYSLAIVIPSIAVSVRRLHDTDHSGWWLLLMFIPLLGALILLVVMCFNSKDDNEYGPNPKAEPNLSESDNLAV